MTELAVWFDGPIEVIPAVDVLGEDAVRLHQGAYDDVVERPGDPVSLAADFASGRRRSRSISSISTAPEAAAYGPSSSAWWQTPPPPPACRPRAASARSRTRRSLLRAGADRVVVGTAALPDPSPWVSQLGEALVVALDVRDGLVRSAGWTRGSGLTTDDALERCVGAGVVRVLCTAIERDGTLAGPDLELVRQVAGSGLQVLAAGGIRNREDVSALAASGAEAAIVGRALLG